MEAIRLHKVVERDGEISLTGLPFKEGQEVEMILLAESSEAPGNLPLTARRLLNSELIGLWKDRHLGGDSTAYARELRDQAQRRDK